MVLKFKSLIFLLINKGAFESKGQTYETINNKILKKPTTEKKRIVSDVSKSERNETLKNDLNLLKGSQVVYTSGYGYKTVMLVDDKVDCLILPSTEYTK